MNTELFKSKVLSMFPHVGTIQGTAKRLGIDRTTIYDWKAKDPVFRLKLESSEVEITEELEGIALERAKRGDNTMLIFLLKARAPQKYMERYKHEIESQQLGRLIGLVTSVLRRTIPQELYGRVSTELLSLETSLTTGNEPMTS